MKVCSACRAVSPPEAFHRDSKARDGRSSTCKSCANANAARWRRENPARVKQTSREWYEANRDRVIERAKRRYAANTEGHRVAIAAWQAANPERVLEYGRRSRERHPEREKARSLRYYEANKDRWRAYAAQRRTRTGPVTAELQRIIAGLIAQSCAYCGSVDRIEVDHVVPLARGGKHEVENLAPACFACNRSKGAKLVSEWLGAA